MLRTANLLLLSMILLLLASPVNPQDQPKQELPSAKPAAKVKEVATYSTPVDAYRAYLNAVKKNDLAAAKSCWWLPGKDDSPLDVIAGIWVAAHRLDAAFAKQGIDGKQFGRDIARDDCTDVAIDRTLARLKDSEVTIKGDTAQLKIKWAKDDGYPNSAFCFSDSPLRFRKVVGGWRFDALAECGIAKPEDFFEKSDWGEMFRGQAVLTNEIAAEIESGKLKTATDIVHALEKRVGSLEGVIPITKTVVYLEDSPNRFLRIKKGNPNICLIAGEQLPHRKDIQYPRRIEGSLQTVFTEMYGVDHPKIVVETKNVKGYEVVYNPDDKQALEIVAKRLGMTVGYEDREILALRITVAKGGHHLKEVPKPDKPQWDCCVTDNTPQAAERHWVWPLHGISMDELALFLEREFRRPVVNKTGLNGYYWLELADTTVRVWPQKMDEIKPLDQTGLEIHWEQTKTKVLIVKDK